MLASRGGDAAANGDDGDLFFDEHAAPSLSLVVTGPERAVGRERWGTHQPVDAALNVGRLLAIAHQNAAPIRAWVLFRARLREV